VLWIYSPTGYGDDFLAWLDTLARGNSHLVTLAFGLIFPVVHSGLASLRSKGEQIVGARTWRVIFASASLPLAYSWIVYFIAHAHDG
jgi:zeta-carotene isomerase